MCHPRDRRESAKRLIDEAIRQGFRKAAGAKSRRALAQLLWTVQGRSDLLRPARYAGRADADALRQVVAGVLALVECRCEWLRPADQWEPPRGGPFPTFSSLAHHLLANYPVPPVLLSGWFLGPDWPGPRYQRCFRHLARGGSLRGAGLPIPVTRRMAHEFAQSPAGLPIEFALRRAQVRGLGGSEALARAVAATRLGREFAHDEFWVSVILMFRNTPRLDPGAVGPIVEYLHDQKFEWRTVIVGEDSEVGLEPPQPDLSVKGRTVASLLRRAERWQAERKPARPERRLLRWEPSGIGEYRRQGGEGQSWTIRELLDSDALAAEGKAMQHCVASYTSVCARRQSTIWSLALEGLEGRRRLVTIEVDPQCRKVVQASMKCNHEPDEQSMAILKDWADREGLLVEGE